MIVALIIVMKKEGPMEIWDLMYAATDNFGLEEEEDLAQVMEKKECRSPGTSMEQL